MNLDTSIKMRTMVASTSGNRQTVKEIAAAFQIDAREELVSTEFVLVDLALHLAAVPVRPIGTLSAAGTGEAPIVVDMNKKRTGSTMSGYVPPVIVVDGRRRHAAARAAGREVIRAWVGLLAAQHLGIITPVRDPRKEKLLMSKDVKIDRDKASLYASTTKRSVKPVTTKMDSTMVLFGGGTTVKPVSAVKPKAAIKAKDDKKKVDKIETDEVEAQDDSEIDQKQFKASPAVKKRYSGGRDSETAKKFAKRGGPAIDIANT